MQQIKIAVAVPCHLFIAPQMAQSLAGMFLDLGKHNIPVGLRFLGNAVSTFGRNALVRWAKENGATHVLWIDTDSQFPPHALRQLLATKKPFVGANFALKDGSGSSACTALDDTRLVARPGGLEEVMVLGFGLTLTTMEVLDAVGEPWFAEAATPEYPGDEIRFCERATRAGFPPFVDHELSTECSHIGLKAFKLGAQCT